MATRVIENHRDRMITILVAPLMSCSARLPVYLLLIAAFIPSGTALGGLVGWQGLAMFGIYFFGMFCGLLVTGLVSRTSKDHYTDLPFVLELPPYRIPGLQPLLRNAWNRAKHFVTKAGKIIFRPHCQECAETAVLSRRPRYETGIVQYRFYFL